MKVLKMIISLNYIDTKNTDEEQISDNHLKEESKNKYPPGDKKRETTNNSKYTELELTNEYNVFRM